MKSYESTIRDIKEELAFLDRERTILDNRRSALRSTMNELLTRQEAKTLPLTLDFMGHELKLRKQPADDGVLKGMYEWNTRRYRADSGLFCYAITVNLIPKIKEWTVKFITTKINLHGRGETYEEAQQQVIEGIYATSEVLTQVICRDPALRPSTE